MLVRCSNNFTTILRRLRVQICVSRSRTDFIGSMSSLQNVFVYGTLKRGEPNHDWLRGAHSFVGVASTERLYPLVIASKYNIPFLLDCPGRGHNVVGEIYRVDDDTLKYLDILEDHPVLYIRKQEDIRTDAGDLYKCWTYFLVNYKEELLELPAYKEYSSKGPHMLEYAEKIVRDTTYDVRNDVLRSWSPNTK